MATKRKTTKRATPAASAAAAQPIVAVVNGQIVPDTVDSGATIIAAAKQLAQAHGIKTFSVKLNGEVVRSQNANAQLPRGAKSLEVFAKDARG